MPTTMPTCPRPTSATSRANPGRSAAPEAEYPRSSSMTSTRDGAHPRATARSASPYCNRVDSVLRSTWARVDWRTYTAARRSRCRGCTVLTGSHSPACVPTPLTPGPARRRRRRTHGQQAQQVPHRRPVQLRERLPCRDSDRRVRRWGGTAASGTATHLPHPHSPAPPAAAARLRPGLTGHPLRGREFYPHRGFLCVQCGLLLDRIL